MALGTNLKKYRLAAGITQRELARRSGVNHSTIAGAEMKPDRTLRTDSVLALAAALEVSVEELVGGPKAAAGSARHPEWVEAIHETATAAVAAQNAGRLIAAMQLRAERALTALRADPPNVAAALTALTSGYVPELAAQAATEQPGKEAVCHESRQD